MHISDIRDKYPQYSDLSDNDFADKFHAKFYADMPKEQFYSKIGVRPEKDDRSLFDKFGHDAISSVMKGITGIPGTLKSIATETIPGAARSVYNRPFSSIGSGVVGGAEALSALGSLPQEGIRYLRQSLGESPEESKGWRTPYEVMLSGEKQLGIQAKDKDEEALRSLAPLLLLHKLPGGAKTRASAIGATEGGKGNDPIEAAIQGFLLEKAGTKAGEGIQKAKEMPAKRRLKKAETDAYNEAPERELSKAEEDFEKADKAYKAGLFDLEREGTPTKESKILKQRDEHQKKIDLFKDALNKPSSKMPNNTPEKLGLARKSAIDLASNEIKSTLAPNEIHDVKLAEEHIAPKVKAINKEVGNEYNVLEKDAAEDKSVLTNTTDAKDIMRQLTAEIRAGNLNFPETLKLGKDLDDALKNQTVSVAEALRNYRSLRTMANKVQSSQFEHGITRDEAHAREEQAKRLHEKVDRLSQLIEEGTTGDYKKRLMKTNKRYATEIIPLRHNKVSKQALYRKRIDSKDIMNELRGDEAGNKIVRDIILSNPEASRLAVGHKYARKPNALINPENTHKPYIAKIPGLAERTKVLSEALERHKTTKLEQSSLAEAIKKAKSDEALREKNQSELDRSKLKIKSLDRDLSTLKKITDDKTKADFVRKAAKEKHISKQKELDHEKSKAKRLLTTIQAYAKGYALFKVIASKIIF